MCANIEMWNAGGLCNSEVTPAGQIPDMHATLPIEIKKAEDFCKDCQIITPCYIYGLENPKEQRVFGGASRRKRIAIKSYLQDNPGTIDPPQPRR